MQKHFFEHYSQVDMAEWRWPNFQPIELASKREGELRIDEDALDKLQELRDILGRPLLLTSAYRSPAHNRAVGGAKGSLHMLARAFDVRMENQDPIAFEQAARDVGFTGFGFYPRSGFMHVDTGAPRSWGTRWPRRVASSSMGPPALAAEPPRQAERPLLDGRIWGPLMTAGTGLATSFSDLTPPVQMTIIGAVACAAVLYFAKDYRWRS